MIEQGLADLAAGVESVPALLVSIGAAHLRRAGTFVPTAFEQPNRRLYRMLQRSHGDAAHSHYNALVRRLVSYQHALQCGN